MKKRLDMMLVERALAPSREKAKAYIEKVRDFAMSISLEPCHLSFSPIKGPEGNIEYLLHLKKRPEGTEVPDSLTVKVEDVVAQAHGALDKPAEK